jgi:hydroxypyruvate isomerase
VTFSACIEWLFTDEIRTFADRIRASRRAGLDAVEFHLWRDKDLDAVQAALEETRLELVALVSDPRRQITKRELHEAFLSDFSDTVAVAQRLNARAVLATIGPAQTDRPREEQRAAVVDVLSEAARIANRQGKLVLVEPLNDVVDHPGFFLTSTTEALDIVEDVAQPNMRMLFDFYHSAMMDEDARKVLRGRMDLVAHVQVADVPGRHEPGSGKLDWRDRVALLDELGYRGHIGLEYKPLASTAASLESTRKALGLD